MSTATLTSWLLTYLLHSTVLLGAAWSVCRLLGDSRFALQEILLRTALIGGILTATVQIGLGVEPLGGAVAFERLTATGTIAASDLSVASPTDDAFEAVASTPSGRGWARTTWSAVLLALWGVGSALALSVLGRSVSDLRRLLETRRFRPAGRLIERLAAAMGLRRSVRLSTSPAIAVPFATGIRRPEICCPERVADLAYEHRKSLFAHELAHLARRDPAWQLVYRLGEAILFLQPLNRLVRRRLEEIAEHLTDERAVACTGDRLGLARCLVVVAHWGVANPPGLPATALAAGPRLDRRVRHLISGAIGSGRPAPWTAALLIATLAGSVVLLPAIAPPVAHADASQHGSGAAPLALWSDADADGEDPMPAPPVAPPVSDAPVPAAPVPVRPDAPESPADVAPAPEVAPVPVIAPLPEAAPVPLADGIPVVAAFPETAPAAPTEPVPAVPPAVAPVSESPAPAPLAEPVAPVIADPPHLEDPATPVPAAEPTERREEQVREEAKRRQRGSRSEREESEVRAREQARIAGAESRALAAQARETARGAAERSRLTEAERDLLRNEAREMQRRTEAEMREHAERSRQLAREAAQRQRLTEAEREVFRCRAEAFRAESREEARELAERARRLAEKAEAERRSEAERRRQRVE